MFLKSFLRRFGFSSSPHPRVFVVPVAEHNSCKIIFTYRKEHTNETMAKFLDDAVENIVEIPFDKLFENSGRIEVIFREGGVQCMRPYDEYGLLNLLTKFERRDTITLDDLFGNVDAIYLTSPSDNVFRKMLPVILQ